MINAAYKPSASELPAPKASLREERTTKVIVDMTDCKRVLYQAAMIVKADINETSGIAIHPLQTADLSLETSKALVPESLYWLLRLIVSSEDTESVSETTDCPSSSDERRILMIGQNIVHSEYHGKVKTPKHMAVPHLTGSKQIIKILNRMGHCASNATVEMIDTSLARKILAKTEAEGVAIPSNIALGSFIQFAADNNDFNKEILDGKQTTHATTLVVYQKGQIGTAPLQRVYADNSQRGGKYENFVACKTRCT